MKYHFSSLTLPSIPQIKASAMLRLASTCGINHPAISVKIFNRSSANLIDIQRDIDRIIVDIEANRGQEISPLEWIYCIYKKAGWDEINQDKSLSTSQSIWKVAESNSWLKKYLFWHLILFAGKTKIKSDRGIFPSSLVSSFDTFTASDDKDRRIVEIARSIIHNNAPSAIAHICYQQKLTPRKLLVKSHLPHRIPAVNEALTYVFDEFKSTSKYDISDLKWLLHCLKDMSLQLQLATVEKLLTGISAEVGGICPDLTNWLVENYSSSAIDSRWQELTNDAKAALRKWIGAVHYGDFQFLVDILTKELGMLDREINQLERRRDFWSNYSDRFLRIRIFLPKSSARILGDRISHQDIGILVEDGSQPTEVCIFDFDNLFVVEFFRGAGSETRFFPNTKEIESILFTSSELSIRKLRSLGNDIHDHVFCWQYYCEQWLRSKDIFPNEGTRYFRGVPKPHDLYSQNYGLPKPSSKDQQERDRQLLDWQQRLNMIHKSRYNSIF